MPKLAKALSDVAVRNLKPGPKARLVPVGGAPGLFLWLTATGGKSWLLRARVEGKQKDFKLGAYPATGLADARVAALAMKDGIREGIAPATETASALTFGEAVKRCHTMRASEFRSEKHAKQWAASLRRHAAPLYPKPVAEITADDVFEVLSPIWESRTPTAKTLRERIEAVLSFAIGNKYRPGPNPAAWRDNLSARLAKPNAIHRKRKQNQPAVALAEAPAFYAALRTRGGMAARALEFAMLTSLRSGEVRGLQWESDVDLKAGIVTIPASRMKMDRDHRVALSPQAVALLEALPRLNGYVFPSRSGAGPLSDMALSSGVMRKMHAKELKAGRKGWLDPRSKKPAVPHGLRTTFKEFAVELTEYPNEISEIALAHKVGSDVELAYRRSDLLERRRSLMNDWASYLGA